MTIQDDNTYSPTPQPTYNTPITIEPIMVAELAADEEQRAVIRRITAQELSNAERAIRKCTKAADAAKKAAIESGLNTKEARYRAVMAFKLHMPRMDTTEGCIEATACAINGMLAGFLDGNEVSKILYAAQIAQSLLRSANR
jgi:hypothetical protein